MSGPRGRGALPPEVNDALARVARELAPPWTYPPAPPVEVAFPVADAARAVQHGLRVVPTGFLVLLSTGPVYAVDVDRWTDTVAYLTSPTAHTVARLWFLQTRRPLERV